jgi:hypothetical protein
MAANIQVLTETEQQEGWLFHVRITEADGSTSDHQVTLSWADYDHWCRGADRPEQVVGALFNFLLHREQPAEILPKFDAALVRRYFPEVDEVLPGLIR